MRGPESRTAEPVPGFNSLLLSLLFSLRVFQIQVYPFPSPPPSRRPVTEEPQAEQPARVFNPFLAAAAASHLRPCHLRATRTGAPEKRPQNLASGTESGARSSPLERGGGGGREGKAGSGGGQRGGPEQREKTRTEPSTPNATFTVLRPGRRERLGGLIGPGGGPRRRRRCRPTPFLPGTAGGAAPRPPRALPAVFDVAASISQDNDEAGTTYLVRSPRTPRAPLAALGPRSPSLRGVRPDRVGAVPVLPPALDQISQQVEGSWMFLNLDPSGNLVSGLLISEPGWPGREGTGDLLTSLLRPRARATPRVLAGDGVRRAEKEAVGGSEPSPATRRPGERGRRGSSSAKFRSEALWISR